HPRQLEAPRGIDHLNVDALGVHVGKLDVRILVVLAQLTPEAAVPVLRVDERARPILGLQVRLQARLGLRHMTVGIDDRVVLHDAASSKRTTGSSIATAGAAGTTHPRRVARQAHGVVVPRVAEYTLAPGAPATTSATIAPLADRSGEWKPAA